MKEQMIISGFGGQGVMSLGQMLTYAGMIEGKHVTWLPSYGAEMRGGSANCSVVISDTPVSSPVVSEATTLIVLNLPSLTKFQPALVAGGKLLFNTSLIHVEPTRQDVEIFPIPANEIADSLGNTRVAGMVMLGAYLKASGALRVESVVEALKTVLGASKANLVAVNEKALAAGAALVG